MEARDEALDDEPGLQVQPLDLLDDVRPQVLPDIRHRCARWVNVTFRGQLFGAFYPGGEPRASKAAAVRS